MIKIKQLLAPTDFSDASAHAMQYAVEFAKTYNAELHLVHVIEPILYPAEMFGQVGLVDAATVIEKAGQEELVEWHAKHIPAGMTCTVTIVHGNPTTEILDYAKEKRIDLIVIATHGRGALDHVLLGSTTEKIVRKSPCPVLTVRAHGKEIIS